MVKFIARAAARRQVRVAGQLAMVRYESGDAYVCEKEGRCEIKLTAWSPDGRTASKTRVMEVQEKPLTAQIVAPSRQCQDAGPVCEPVCRPLRLVEWSFGDGTSSAKRIPFIPSRSDRVKPILSMSGYAR